MSTADDGIKVMRDRIARGTRQPPRPRSVTPRGSEFSAPEVRQNAPESRGRTGAPSARRSATAGGGRLILSPDGASANLAIRVRRPLDERLAELIHQLRREGVRTSKVELIEMMLYELPEQITPDLRRRLSRFRDRAPRGSAGPLDT